LWPTGNNAPGPTFRPSKRSLEGSDVIVAFSSAPGPLFDQVAGCTGCEFIEGAVEGVSRNAPLERTGITAPATGLSAAEVPGAIAADVGAPGTAALDHGQAAAAGGATVGVPGCGNDSAGAAAGAFTVAGRLTAAVLTASAGFTGTLPGFA
jgi:hypothetical protein